MIHEQLSGKIIGAGMDVLNELRPGLDDPAAAGLRTRNWAFCLILRTRDWIGNAYCARENLANTNA